MLNLHCVKWSTVHIEQFSHYLGSIENTHTSIHHEMYIVHCTCRHTHTVRPVLFSYASNYCQHLLSFIWIVLKTRAYVLTSVLTTMDLQRVCLQWYITSKWLCRLYKFTRIKLTQVMPLWNALIELTISSINQQNRC